MMPTRLPSNKCLYELILSKPVFTEASQPETNVTKINIVDTLLNRIFSFYRQAVLLCLTCPYYTLELSKDNLSLKTIFYRTISRIIIQGIEQDFRAGLRLVEC